ncbi:hypothetical protein PPERSA_02266 [Pseudocohnilembus persalinus]|uniref:Transmembrane protein n=1 Tax=Pseudocohnilembus persalinus TaxID=266149 RepID=A0A0V0QL18_PSEPJ|nr:hypothetical protein PPERSA_02266 [Pseudocohnilembus persalinus]|eukprot:KRX02776.1 hypothetical protein PPERSA_02266 [Pseudocohnilembus persalinus]
MTRIIQNQYYEKKKSTPFQYLSQKTQEFIADPLDIQQLKNFHNIGTHYPDLVKIEYLKQQKQQGTQFNLQNEYYNGKPQISLKKKLYILLVNVCHVISIVIIQVQVDYSMYYVPAMLRKSLTTLFIMPQFIVYTVIRLKKQNKTVIQKLGLFVIDLAKIPFIHLFAWAQLISPIKNENIPFIKEIKETWLTNYFPSDYTLVIRQFLYSFWIYCLYQLFENQKGYPVLLFQNYVNLRQVGEITANDSPLKILFWIGFILFFFNSLQFILYYYEKLVHKKLQKVQLSQIIKKKKKYQKIIDKLQLQVFNISSTIQQSQSIEKTVLPSLSTQNLKMSIFSNQGLQSSNNVNLLEYSRKNSQPYNGIEKSIQNQPCQNSKSEDFNDKIENQQNQDQNEDFKIQQELDEQASARNTEFQSPRKLLSDVQNANDIDYDFQNTNNRDYLDEEQGKFCGKQEQNVKILSRQIKKILKN